MKIKEGKILPNIGIGEFKLNMKKQDLLDIIGEEYEERLRENDSVISIENAKFWIDEDGKLDQIGVTKGFQGKYKNTIGIGSNLAEVQARVGQYVENGDTYEMEDDKGICFELEDVDDWEELIAPIEYIFVFRV